MRVRAPWDCSRLWASTLCTAKLPVTVAHCWTLGRGVDRMHFHVHPIESDSSMRRFKKVVCWK